MPKKTLTVFLYDTTTQGPLLGLLYERLSASGAQVVLAHYNRLYNVMAVPTWCNHQTQFDLSGHPFHIHQLLSRTRPDVVVLFDKGSLLDRAVIRAAQRLHIRTLQVQHGLVSSSVLEPRSYSLSSLVVRLRFLTELFTTYLIASVLRDFWFFFRTATYKYLFQLFHDPHRHYFRYRDEVVCDGVAVFSPEDRDFFLRHDGYSPKSVHIVGQPFLDTLYHRSLQPYQAPPTSPYFLFVSQPFVEDQHEGWTRQRWDDLLRLCAQAAWQQGCTLVVKPHPREHRADYEHLRKSAQGLALADEHMSLDELVLSAQGVLGFFSTALSMAVVTNKPLGILRLQNEHFLIDYVKIGVGYDIRTPRNLRTFMKNALSGKRVITARKRQKYIARYLGFFDGKSIDRILAQIDTGLAKKG